MMLLGDLRCLASLADAVSYSSARRNVVSILFLFRKSMCKIFLVIFPLLVYSSPSPLVIQCSHS